MPNYSPIHRALYNLYIKLRHRTTAQKNGVYVSKCWGGLTFCERWANKEEGLKNFLHDLIQAQYNPSLRLTLINWADEIGPNNIDLVTPGKVKRKPHTKTQKQIAIETGLNQSSISRRLKRGFTLHQVYSTIPKNLGDGLRKYNNARRALNNELYTGSSKGYQSFDFSF